ncbi:unnamed protein product [Amoebophrya sp. A25]|nr:unnamed protein product [Amoebophrya sp. A25]|eukprot:GSA25T00008873001.1
MPRSRYYLVWSPFSCSPTFQSQTPRLLMTMREHELCGFGFEAGFSRSKSLQHAIKGCHQTMTLRQMESPKSHVAYHHGAEQSCCLKCEER